MYILNRKLFESVNQAKNFLDSKKIPFNDKRFLDLKYLLRENPKYIGKFTEWMFNEDLDIEYIENLYKFLKEYKLDKDINDFTNSEDLYDYLTNLKLESKINKAINVIPSRTRKLVNKELRDLLRNNVEYIDSINKFYLNKSGRYDNINDLIKDTEILITNILGGWSPDVIDYEEDELVYKDDTTLILHIKNFERSCDLGSKYWCISTDEEHFDEYILDSDYSKQYFIYDFSKNMSDNRSMIGVTVREDGTISAMHLKDDTEAEMEDIEPFMNYLKPYSQEYIKANPRPEDIFMEEIEKITRRYNFGYLEKSKGHIVSDSEYYDSLTELLKDINDFREEIKEENEDIYYILDIRLLKDRGEEYFDDFQTSNVWQNDDDWVYTFTGSENTKDEEIEEHIENLTSDMEFDTNEEKEEYIKDIMDSFEINWIPTPHAQFYINNDFSNLDKVEKILESDYDDILYVSKGNLGASDENSDYYSEIPAIISFGSIKDIRENM